MALSKTVLPGRFGANFSTETVANNSASAIAASSSTLFSVQIDNTGNSANSFVKLYNLAAGSTTVGSDDPFVILKAQASRKVTYHFNQGIAFSAAIALACVTTAGTAGSSSPSASVPVKLVYD